MILRKNFLLSRSLRARGLGSLVRAAGLKPRRFRVGGREGWGLAVGKRTR